MTWHEFFEITKKIEEYYDKQYSTEQMQIMYEQLKDWDKDKYRVCVDYVLRRSKYLPKLADLFDAVKETKVKKEQEKEHTECDTCNGTGYIQETRLINGLDYKFAHICPDCDNAEEYDGKLGYYCHKYKPLGGAR